MLNTPGVVIVNYNTLELSLEAIASVFEAEQMPGKTRVVLIDNASTTHSFSQLVAAAHKRLKLSVVVTRDGINDLSKQADVVIIDAGRNDGFAAGCNIGLRWLKQTDTDLFVLLNPDACLHRAALRAFAAKLSSDQSYGLVGATLLDAAHPHKIQALSGAKLSNWSLLGQNLSEGKTREAGFSEQEVERTLSYPVGAALAFRCDWLDYAGFMDEQYFLYYEEIDWVRSGAKKYRPGWASEAIVYHHRGAVAGSHLAEKMRSPLADYHMIRSRMLFTLKWQPWLFPLICVLSAVQMMRRILRGQWLQALAIARGCLPNANRKFN